MSTLTENNIIDAIYELYETDDDHWSTTSAEYLTCRGYANAAINLWKRYRSTQWKELWTTLTASTQSDPALVKTLTAGTHTYTCPTDFVKPSSWVKTVDGNSDTHQFYEVINPEASTRHLDSPDYVCWFTGSEKAGFVLNFNSKLTLATGHTIDYEYYKSPTLFATTSSTTEMADPYFIVYYVLARLLKNDGEDYREEKEMYQELLEEMRVNNMLGVFDVPNPLNHSLVTDYGFGE